MAKDKNKEDGTATAAVAAKARKPRDKKSVIIEKQEILEDGVETCWAPDGEETFADTAEAEAHLSNRATPGRFRILTVQREVTVREVTVKRVVLE